MSSSRGNDRSAKTFNVAGAAAIVSAVVALVLVAIPAAKMTGVSVAAAKFTAMTTAACLAIYPYAKTVVEIHHFTKTAVAFLARINALRIQMMRAPERQGVGQQPRG